MSRSDCKSIARGIVIALRLAALAAVTLPASSTTAEVVSLPTLNVDIKETSVSGLSSGGYMAVQFDVAYSSIIKGAGIIAGGPYFCARENVDTATRVCSCTSQLVFLPCSAANGATNVPQLVNITNQNASAGAIDPTFNLRNQRIFLFSGKADSKIPQTVMNDLQTYYRHYIGSASIKYQNSLPGKKEANHAMPTRAFGNPCSSSEPPFINNCGYDTAGEILKWIYGSLSNKKTGRLPDSAYIQFDQRPFLSASSRHGMDDSGWLYVPASCSNGQRCRLHVAFHGCQQGQSFVPFIFPVGQVGTPYGMTFVRHAGYNVWADTNKIVVLYPQVVQAFPENQNGCWDWWGYDDPNYAKKSGHQMAAVKAMIDRLASGRVVAQAGALTVGQK